MSRASPVAFALLTGLACANAQAWDTVLKNNDYGLTFDERRALCERGDLPGDHAFGGDGWTYDCEDWADYDCGDVNRHCDDSSYSTQECTDLRSSCPHACMMCGDIQTVDQCQFRQKYAYDCVDRCPCDVDEARDCDEDSNCKGAATCFEGSDDRCAEPETLNREEQAPNGRTCAMGDNTNWKNSLGSSGHDCEDWMDYDCGTMSRDCDDSDYNAAACLKLRKMCPMACLLCGDSVAVAAGIDQCAERKNLGYGCISACPCEVGDDRDCDEDSECQGEAVCLQQSGDDVCVLECEEADRQFRIVGKCTSGCPCGEGAGDCDADDECFGDLVCIPSPDGQLSGGSQDDLCGHAGMGSGHDPFPNATQGCAKNGRYSGPGQFDDEYCSTACPCEEGQGDCSADEECAGDLICIAGRKGAIAGDDANDFCGRADGTGLMREAADGEACECLDEWSTLDGTNGSCMNQTGCVNCDDDSDGNWCMVKNLGCAGDVDGNSGGWFWCGDVCDADRTWGLAPAGVEECSVDCPCGEGGGDCDSHDDCSGDLICIAGNDGDIVGDDYNDYCGYAGNDPWPNAICTETVAGYYGSDYCTPWCPCQDGMGDCDSDDECAGNLICIGNYGQGDADDDYDDYCGVEILSGPERDADCASRFPAAPGDRSMKFKCNKAADCEWKNPFGMGAGACVAVTGSPIQGTYLADISEDCVCQDTWRWYENEYCDSTQNGCTNCDGQDDGGWCMVRNLGCKQDEPTSGGGWFYCETNANGAGPLYGGPRPDQVPALCQRGDEYDSFLDREDYDCEDWSDWSCGTNRETCDDDRYSKEDCAPIRWACPHACDMCQDVAGVDTCAMRKVYEYDCTDYCPCDAGETRDCDENSNCTGGATCEWDAGADKELCVGMQSMNVCAGKKMAACMQTAGCGVQKKITKADGTITAPKCIVMADKPCADQKFAKMCQPRYSYCLWAMNQKKIDSTRSNCVAKSSLDDGSFDCGLLPKAKCKGNLFGNYCNFTLWPTINPKPACYKGDWAPSKPDCAKSLTAKKCNKLKGPPSDDGKKAGQRICKWNKKNKKCAIFRKKTYGDYDNPECARCNT